MAIRTYFWNTKRVPRLQYYRNKLFRPHVEMFKYGNAGDIFNADLIQYLYSQRGKNLSEVGNRLLLVGSVMSIIEKGDIVCGIGWKGNDLSKKSEILESATVYGVRGPLTKQLFENNGTDLSTLKFEYDPGLLIKEVYQLDMSKATSESVIFIPHFRDIYKYKGDYPEAINMVQIDAKPKALAHQILKAKVVYSASLHGIIFAHALGKPCVFVAPQSEEPIFKYRDYFLSIGMEMPTPVKSIHHYNFSKDIETSLEKPIGLDDFYFPPLTYLKDNKILF